MIRILILHLCIFFPVLLFCQNSNFNDDVTNDLWHSEKRHIRYKPEGNDFIIINGERRFNRALYGSNTAFRAEAGDLPEFALFMPGMGGNLKFGLIIPDTSKWLKNSEKIISRYRPGSMIYEITDPLLDSGKIHITILALHDNDGIIIKFQTENINKNCELLWAFGGGTGKKFFRNGDIGADPESVFYLHPEYCEGNEYQTKDNKFRLFYGPSVVDSLIPQELTSAEKINIIQENRKKVEGIVPLSSAIKIADAFHQESPESLYNSERSENPVVTGKISLGSENEFFFLLQKPEHEAGLIYDNVSELFNNEEKRRKEISERIQVNTPDPYINTFGGALSIAADAIWEEPSYLHGAVAWRMRLNGWRGAYAADWLGSHDRARMHFDGYSKSQYTSPDSGPNVPDPKTNFARQEEKAGNSVYTSGYISRNPGEISKPHHYDMNLIFIDQLLWHIKWTGDLEYAKKMWPLIERHLAWEKRCFDGNNDGLYDAYCCIWASDALQYSGGGVTHSSAYNYRANKLAIEIAALIGEDAEKYAKEAEKIYKAVNSQLWMTENGWYAEYIDLNGNKSLHPSAGLWTVYHAIDSELPDAFRKVQLLNYVDNQIPHIPIVAEGLPNGYYHLLSTTDWMPYTWSINNVTLAENLHTALAYWQGGRNEDAFILWKSSLLESMYLGASPGNFQQLSFYDAFRGELYRDFADPVGVAARTLTEGLFGITPDALHDTLYISPGLPEDWNFASLKTPDFVFDYKRNENTDSYTISSFLPKKMTLKLKLNARKESIQSVTINGIETEWKNAGSVGKPEIEVISGYSDEYKINIVWQGKDKETLEPNYYGIVNEKFNLEFKQALVKKIYDPQKVLRNFSLTKNGLVFEIPSTGNKTFFIQLNQGDLSWWQPVNILVKNPVEVISEKQKEDQLEFRIKNNSDKEINPKIMVNAEVLPFSKHLRLLQNQISEKITIPSLHLIPGNNAIKIEVDGKFYDTIILNWNIKSPQNISYETQNLNSYFNDKITSIFRNRYLSPRSPYPTLQLPLQGTGDWCSYSLKHVIDDSGLRKISGTEGKFTISQGITFATPGDTTSSNVIYTSMWDNYPSEIVIPVTGKSSHAYFLMTGSAHHMQSRFVNGKIIVEYTDGSKKTLELVNPQTWWPIEQDYYDDGFAFSVGSQMPLRINLKTGEIRTSPGEVLMKNNTNKIDGGAATIYDLTLDPSKELKKIILRTTANDVVIGLIGLTLARLQ